MKTEWIDKNYNELRQTALNITKNENSHIFEDFFHDCLIILIEHDKFQDLIKTDEVKFFFTRILLNQWRSSSSPTYKKYKQMKTQEITDFNTSDDSEYDYDQDNRTEGVLNALDEMLKSDVEKHREFAMIILHYHSNGCNFTKLGKILKQDRSLLGKKYKQGIKTLKEEYYQDEFEITTNLSKAMMDSDLLKYDEPQLTEWEEFEMWSKNNRVKYFNPHKFTKEEKEYILKTYNDKYNTNYISGCGKCFYNRLFHFKKMFFGE